MRKEEKIMHVHKNRTSFGLAILRLGLGVIFIGYGFAHVNELLLPAQFSQHADFGMFLSRLMSYGEIVAGCLVILGVFTRIASGFLAVMIGLMILYVHSGARVIGIHSNELELALFVMSAALIFLGPGSYALGALFCKCCRTGKCKGEGCSCHAVCDGGDCSFGVHEVKHAE